MTRFACFPFKRNQPKIMEAKIEKPEVEKSVSNDQICVCGDTLWASMPYLLKSSERTALDTLSITQKNGCGCLIPTERFQAIIQSLKDKCPNLEELKIRSPIISQHSFGLNEMGSIVKLKRLTHVEFEFVSIPLSDFVEITRQCDNIEFITSNSIILDLKLTESLFDDKFVYQNINARSLRVKRINRLTLSTTMQPQEESYSINFQRYCILSLQPKSVVEFDLIEYLFQITHARIDCIDLEDEVIDENDESLDIAFPWLPQLLVANFTCSWLSGRAIKSFLIQNGESLAQLSIKYLEPRAYLTFDDIFCCCPALQMLSLDRSFVSNDPPIDSKMDRFYCLHWNYPCKYDAVDVLPILRAPNIRQLCVTAHKIEWGNVEEYKDLIQEPGTLKNLTYLKLEEAQEQESAEGTDFKKIITSILFEKGKVAPG